MGKLFKGVLIIALLVAGVVFLSMGLNLRKSNLLLQQQLATELAATPTPTADIRSMLLVTAAPGTAPAATALLLKTGSKGDTVVKVQERLIALGYLSGNADGQYGPGTKAAVTAFQEQCSLEADGMVGESTWNALFSASAPTCAPSATPSPTPAAAMSSLLKKGSSGEAVKTLQLRLAELGFYSGSADGDFGSATEAALIKFQKQHGLSADGIAASETYSVLFSANAQAFTPTPTPNPDSYLVLINRDHPVTEDYTPQDLVLLSSIIPTSLATLNKSDLQGDAVAVNALKAMLEASAQDNQKNWKINAAYRSYAYQQQLFNQSVQEYVQKGFSQSKAISATRQTVADPGCSEHHSGLAFDITVKNASQFEGTEQQIWLHQHCWDYGFIIRYQKGKEAITGYIAECWHIRYVGIEHSQLMYKSGQCLEEYLGVAHEG